MKFLHFNIPIDSKAPLRLRKQYQSRTVAVEPIPADRVIQLASNFLNSPPKTLSNEVALNVGVTLCSLKDRYSKKEGRVQAIAKQSIVSLTVEQVTVTKTHVFIQLNEYKGVTLVLRANKATGFSCVIGSLTLGE